MTYCPLQHSEWNHGLSCYVKKVKNSKTKYHVLCYMQKGKTGLKEVECETVVAIAGERQREKGREYMANGPRRGEMTSTVY